MRAVGVRFFPRSQAGWVGGLAGQATQAGQEANRGQKRIQEGVGGGKNYKGGAVADVMMGVSGSELGAGRFTDRCGGAGGDGPT